MNAVIRAEAETDLLDAALWYEKQETGLGRELLVQIREAIQKASRNPRGFLKVRTNPEVRRILARRFPYRIFFIVRSDAIIVFAILHAARHDRHWRARLE